MKKRILVFATGLSLVASAAGAQEWWSAPADLGGVPLASGPAVVHGGIHPIDVFYRGPKDHLWMSWWDGGPWWSAPADLGGVALTSEPTVVTGGAHKIDVFYRGPNNHLWTSWFPDKPGGQWWSAPTDLGGVALTSAPTAVTGGTQRIQVFYRGPNNHLWESGWPDKPGGRWWSAPADLGGVALTSAPAAVTGGTQKVQVFYRGPNNHLWESWWPDKPGGQWWSAPADLGGVALTSAPVAVTNARHTVDVFYAGPNSHLWTSWWPDKPGGQWWSGAADLGGVALTSAPAVVAAARDKLDVFYRGPNDHLWTSWWPAEPWVDVQTRRPSPQPAPFDLVAHTFDPDNGLPLNPMFGSQTWSTPQLADPSLCGGHDPWKAPCTNQSTWIDNNVGLCLLSPGSLHGHANWGLALYEGTLSWHDHSYYLQDDDYSFSLLRDDLAGLTRADVDGKDFLHSEFNSNETINTFHTWFWDTLHHAVDDDGGVGGFRHGPWPKTRPLFDNRTAIVMGLFGLDCAHSCGSELHPVYAMAIHLSGDGELNDDVWAIFVRNWGDEGYCGSGQERIASSTPYTFTFRLKHPGATGVSSIPAASSDQAGQHGTSIMGDSGAISWGGPFLVPNEGATVSFTLQPTSKGGGRINGMLHLKWSVAAGTSTARAGAPFRAANWRAGEASQYATRPSPSLEVDEPELRLAERVTRMTPAEREAAMKAAPPPPPPPASVRVPATAARPPAPVALHRVERVPDELREKRQAQVQEVLRRVAPGQFQLPPPPR